jgi:hypothetical protein
MEVMQKLQPVQDEACKVFEEIDGQGSQLDQVVAVVEQCLEGPVTEKTIQELTEQEAQVKQQVEAAQVKLRPSKQHCLHLSDSGRVTGECWGLVGPRPSFGKTSVNFDPLLDFDTLVEEGAPRWS